MEYIPDIYRTKIKLTKLNKRFKVYTCFFNYFRKHKRYSASVLFYSFLYDSAVKTSTPYLYTTYRDIMDVWEEKHHKTVYDYLRAYTELGILSYQIMPNMPVVNDTRYNRGIKSPRAKIVRIELYLQPSDIEHEEKKISNMSFNAPDPMTTENILISYLKEAKRRRIKEISLLDLAKDLGFQHGSKNGSVKDLRRIIKRLDVQTSNTYFNLILYP